MAKSIVIALIALTSGVSGFAAVTRRTALGAATAGLAAQATRVQAQDDATFKSVATQVGGDDYASLPGGLKYKEVRPGAGTKAAIGDTVQVQFSGRCLNLNGKKFISTQDPAALASGLSLSEPFTFTLGSGKVIPGLDQAVVGMSKGGYRRVVIPQALGYDTAMTCV